MKLFVPAEEDHLCRTALSMAASVELANIRQMMRMCEGITYDDELSFMTPEKSRLNLYLGNVA